MSYNAKQELVQDRQLKVQRLVIPFAITANATPASVVISRDDPSILFLRTQGVDEITAALDTADGTPSYASANDASGVFNILVKIQEQIGKVMHAEVVQRTVAAQAVCTLAAVAGITAAGDKIALNCTLGNLATTNMDACLVVEYVVAE